MIGRIEITYDDGMVATFTKQGDGSWIQNIDGDFAITDYDPPNVLRVLSAGLGTRKIAL